MAQTLKIADIDGYICYDITDIFDKEEIAQLAIDCGIETDEVSYDAYWYECGDGESGTDYFVSNKELDELIESGVSIDDIERYFEDKGYIPELIQSTNDSLCLSDFDYLYEDDEPADIDDDCGFDPYAGCYSFDC